MENGTDLLIGSKKKDNILKRYYDWTRHWAKTPYGNWALFIVAFAEASFFPVPPDVLLLILAVSRPKMSFIFALICSLGSVLGGCLGYYLGYQFFEFVGKPILDFYGLMESFGKLSDTFKEHSFLAIMTAGLTPVPYKVFTISSGFCNVDFFTLLVASLASRSLRFFAEAGLIFVFGSKIEKFIEQYFNVLSILFIILLILGFVVIKLFH